MIKTKLVTIVIYKEIRERLREIRDEILARTGEQIGFSDIIKYALNNIKDIVELIAEKLVNHKRVKRNKAKKQKLTYE